MIRIGKKYRSSLYGLNFSFHGLRNSPTELKKYGPPSNILFLSSRLQKMTVKKPLAPKCRSKCSRGFHVTLIHQSKSFSDGQIPTNFSIRAWSLLCYKYDLKPSSFIYNEGISFFWLCIFWCYALALFLFLTLYPWCLLSLYSDDLFPCPC